MRRKNHPVMHQSNTQPCLQHKGVRCPTPPNTSDHIKQKLKHINPVMLLLCVYVGAGYHTCIGETANIKTMHSSMYSQPPAPAPHPFGTHQADPAAAATHHHNNVSTPTTNSTNQGFYTQLPPITTAAINPMSAAAAHFAATDLPEPNGGSLSMLDHNNTHHDDMDSRRSISTTSSYSATSMGGHGSWMYPPPHQQLPAVPKDSISPSASSTHDLPYHGQPTPTPSCEKASTSSSSTATHPKRHRTPSTKDIHVEKNTEGKPPYSYATLIKYAIENSPQKKLTLSEIYQWVIEHYPYYSTAGTGWKNSIRHNLSLNKSFVRVARPINEPGKGSYWVVDYNAVEAEHRSRYSMSMRGGRNSRSGSDPAPSPYRPESWSSSLNPGATPATAASGRRYRDGRSLSADANALSMLPQQPHTTNAVAVAAAASNTYGYYPYYNRPHFGHYHPSPTQQQQPTPHHHHHHHHHHHPQMHPLQRPVDSFSNRSTTSGGPCAQPGGTC
ncbi:hypothetical protein K492DRAFT_183622 [Lichtheimia hyalospora FSU 10163]|nr:hypothetical protein K492DRAFT_183622 [Lichtheimia hyalospora FSU 10163]